MVLLAQISIGIYNVVGGLPLANAVAHNGMAAILLGVLLMLLDKTRCAHRNDGDAAPATRLAFLDLCKPRVVALIVFTAMVGMALSTPGPGAAVAVCLG